MITMIVTKVLVKKITWVVLMSSVLLIHCVSVNFFSTCILWFICKIIFTFFSTSPASELLEEVHKNLCYTSSDCVQMFLTPKLQKLNLYSSEDNEDDDDDTTLLHLAHIKCPVILLEKD